MKRLMLVAALAAALIVPAGSAHAATLYRSSYITAYYSAGGSTLSVSASVAVDVLGNGPTYTYGFAMVVTPAGSDYGTGTFDVELDPTATVGTITGTIPGGSGPITVDLTFVGLSASTSNPPSAWADLNPFTPQAFAGYGYGKSGTAAGTATSAYGTVNATGASAWSSAGAFATAP